VRVAAVVSDLMLWSRIESAVTASGGSLLRVDEPASLPSAAQLDLVLVDWSSRRPRWAADLLAWRGPSAGRLVLFGRHTDLEAHADAKAAGLGPMWARSKLIAELPSLMRGSEVA
jgi:hypothetical protein